MSQSQSIIPDDPPRHPPSPGSRYFESPCLMYSQRSSNNSWKLYHSLNNEFFYLDLPELKDAEILYSKFGWLLMSRDECSSLFFFNPLTRQKFQLPPTDEPFYAVCFTSPPTCSDCFVFGYFCSTTTATIEFALFKFGDEEWKIDSLDCDTQEFSYSNCPPLFHNGMYYCFDLEWRVFRVYDPAKDEWTICGHYPEKIEDEEVKEEKDEEKEEEEDENEEEEEEETKESYIVEVEGEIWGVFVMNNDRKVSVSKFDLSEKCWNKVESLGDKCLYVSVYGSFAEDCGGGDRANKIYFNKFHGENGVWYSLATGMYHSVGGDFASKDAYGLTQVDYGTWIKST